MLNKNKLLELKNKQEIRKSEKIANEIKESVKYHLYDDGFILL